MRSFATWLFQMALSTESHLERAVMEKAKISGGSIDRNSTIAIFTQVLIHSLSEILNNIFRFSSSLFRKLPCDGRPNRPMDEYGL